MMTWLVILDGGLKNRVVDIITIAVSGRKEIFNDTLNTFYLRLYGIRHMVNTTQSKRGNPLPPHGLLIPISSKGYFICIIHRQDSTYIIMAFVT